MKLLVASFVVLILMLLMTPLAASSFGPGSSNHVPFSPDKSYRTLTSPNAQSDGWFGTSVAMGGNLVAVGATDETADGYSAAGHAYVFNATSGASIVNLTSPNAQNDGEFGVSVSMSGKLVTVGAWNEEADGYSYAGHAYVFNATSGHLVRTLTSPNAQHDGRFGDSVSISGNLVAVGAYYETADGHSYAGNAYVFNVTSGNLITTLTSPNAQRDGYFGDSVSISGDLVTVGAWNEVADGYSSAGHAYVFNATSGHLITKLTSPNAQDYGLFGSSVSMTGNLVTVGASHETADGYTEAGHAYVFNATSGHLITKLTSPHAQSDGEFGDSVSVSGNLVTVGAYYETADGYSVAGNAYVFNATSGHLITKLTSPNAQSGGKFGYLVSMSGNLVAVGAPDETADGYSGAGHAYIFYQA